MKLIESNKNGKHEPDAEQFQDQAQDQDSAEAVSLVKVCELLRKDVHQLVHFANNVPEHGARMGLAKVQLELAFSWCTEITHRMMGDASHIRDPQMAHCTRRALYIDTRKAAVNAYNIANRMNPIEFNHSMDVITGAWNMWTCLKQAEQLMRMEFNIPYLESFKIK